jgi:predicted enzyme related to lactoylglutathione lyase
MKRVTGIGGIFFKAQNADVLRAWYAKHLGMPVESWGGLQFHWRRDEDPRSRGYTVWSVFDADTRYFDPSEKPFMINYRVDDLDAVLAALRSEGVTVEEKIEESEYGRFGWAMDPEGNRIELWEPPEEAKSRLKEETR